VCYVARGNHDAHHILHHACREGVEPAADHSDELPEFAIRALEHRVEMTNAGGDDEEMVSFINVVEWYLLSPLSVKEMPHLEDAVPGFTAALVRWMIDSTYSGAE
jgi:hypothetical protein